MPSVHQRIARLLTYVTLVSLLSGFLPPPAHAQTSGSPVRYHATASSIMVAGTETSTVISTGRASPDRDPLSVVTHGPPPQVTRTPNRAISAAQVSGVDALFSARDGGRAGLPGIAVTATGVQPMAVADRSVPSLPMPNHVGLVQTIGLSVTVSPTSVFAGAPTLAVTVTAQDADGTLVPGYRGTVRFSSSSAMTGLPRGGLGGQTYTFTAGDAGQHTWSGVTLNTAGNQTITVSDGTRQATSGTITVQAIHLTVTVSPTVVFAGEPAATVTVSARDQSDTLVPGYRGTVTFSSSSAMTGLPQGGLGGQTYTFTAGDGGQHTWTGVTLNTAGDQTVTVSDGTRQATSAPVTVKAVQLTATISPTLFFAGEPVQVLVTARDQDDALVPGYRGTVTFSSSSTITGLPQGGLGGSTYTFTAGDAGQHTWSGATLNTAGDQTVTVSDGTRQATSNTVTVKPIAFQITFDPPTSYVNDATLTMTLQVVDAATGAVVPGYRGAIDLNPSVPMRGLPQGAFAANPDYVFTAADAGRHVFPDLGFTATGDQTITVVDRGNPATQTTSGAVGVGLPPAPTPAAAGPMPPTVIFPFTVPGQQPAPFPFSWAPPYRAMESYTGPNRWEGYPKRPVPADPGAFAITSGISQRGPLEWWAGTFYIAAATGWENPLTAARELHGPSISYLPFQDPTFVGGYGTYGWGDWSDYFNTGAVTFLSPMLAGPAPAGTQGAHVNAHPGGNVGGSFVVMVNSAGDDIGCDGSGGGVQVADPVDTRSGAFFLRETDLGVATGCTDVALQFTRTYHTLTGASSALSPGWVHNYEQRIQITGDYALMQRPSGGTLLFKDVGGDVYAAPAGAKHTLVKRAGGGWALVYRTQRMDVFDAAGRLVAEQDPNGNLIWLTYETYQRNGVSGTRLARVDAPGGRFLWFGYDYYRPARISVVGDNAGRSVQYRYDDADAYDFTSTGKLVGVTDPLSHTSQYTYTDTWLLTEKTDPLGTQVFSNTYDMEGRVAHQINRTGQDITFTYAVITDTATMQAQIGATEASSVSALLVTTATDQTGTASYVYGADGLLRRVTDPTGATTRYRGYTATRKATIIEDALGHVTQATYNAQGLPTTITDTLGSVTHMSYDAWGQATQITARGQTFAVAYTGPNATQVTSPSGATLTLTYRDQAGWKQRLSTIAHAGTMTTTLTYDAAGDVTDLADALGRMTTLSYDAVGRPTRMTDPRGATTTLTYDAADQLTGVAQHADGITRTTTFQYNAAGHLTSLTDPLSQTTALTSDSAGRVITQTLADGRPVSFTYDASSNLTSLTPPERPAHQFASTPAGVLTQYQPPPVAGGANPTQYAHDLLQQLTRLTRADGSTVDVGYDALGRTTAITDSSGVTQRGYDASTGDLNSVTSPSGTTSYGYDAARRPVAATWTGAVSGTVQVTPNTQGWITAQQVNSLPAIAFAYAADGMLTAAGALALTPTAAGLLDGTTLGSVTDQWSYNGFAEPTGYTATVSGTAVFDLQTTRDALGRIGTRTEAISGTTTTTAYSYDAVGQLSGVTQDGSPVAQYSYDANGNRTSTTANGSTTSATYDAQDRLLTWGGTSYAYNANGDRATATTSGQMTTYLYDPDGNLQHVGMPDGTTVTYLRDSSGRRVGRQVNGTLTQGWLYQDDLNPVAELDASGNVVSQFVYADRATVPAYMIKNGETYRIISDLGGSPRLVIDTATGAVVQELRYDAWGTVLLDTNPGFQPFGFAGGLHDPATGLTHFGARDYDAAVGRWLQKDPIGFGGGDTNLYRYVGNDPVNFIDPSGLFIDTILDVGFVMYDLYRLKTEPCDVWWNLAALGLDVVGALLPFVTGLGTLAHGARYAEEGWEASRFADEAWEAGRCLNSFSGDTPVDTADGPRPIQTIAVGDQVWAWDAQTDTTGVYTVTDIIHHQDAATLWLNLDGERIETTPEHPFYVLLRGWIDANDLHVGDWVRQRDNDYGQVQATWVEAQPQTMYNLTVATAHTFFVGDGQWLVHNTCPFNPFTGKTAQEIDAMFHSKGFDPRGPDPVNGLGGYVNPKTGRSYHIDPANSYGEPPHVDVNRPREYRGPLPKRKFGY